ERAGVGFHGPFRIGRSIEPPVYQGAEPLQLDCIKPSRCPTAYKNGVDRLRPVKRHRQLALQRAEIPVRETLSAGDRREIAVPTLVGAERDVNISSTRPLPGWLRVARAGFRDHTTASTKRMLDGRWRPGRLFVPRRGTLHPVDQSIAHSFPRG